MALLAEFQEFEDFFKGYTNIDKGGEADQFVLSEAKKIIETLKTTKAVMEFSKKDLAEQQKMVSGLSDHSAVTLACAVDAAYKYAYHVGKSVTHDFEGTYADCKNPEVVKYGKMITETLKTPEDIETFMRSDWEKRKQMVPGLPDKRLGIEVSYDACAKAYNYAASRAKYLPYNFDDFFEGYKNYDNGGEIDRGIVQDSKKVFRTLRTPEKIEAFMNADHTKQQEMVGGLSEDHLDAVCSNAYRFAKYYQKYVENGGKEAQEEQKTEQQQQQPKDNFFKRLFKRIKGKTPKEGGFLNHLKEVTKNRKPSEKKRQEPQVTAEVPKVEKITGLKEAPVAAPTIPHGNKPTYSVTPTNATTNVNITVASKYLAGKKDY